MRILAESILTNANSAGLIRMRRKGFGSAARNGGDEVDLGIGIELLK